MVEGVVVVVVFGAGDELLEGGGAVLRQREVLDEADVPGPREVGVNMSAIPSVARKNPGTQPMIRRMMKPSEEVTDPSSTVLVGVFPK